MQRIGLVAACLTILVACAIGPLSDAEREWCAANYLTVYRTGQELDLDMREWTEDTEWPLATRPAYMRACRNAYDSR